MSVYVINIWIAHCLKTIIKTIIFNAECTKPNSILFQSLIDHCPIKFSTSKRELNVFLF